MFCVDEIIVFNDGHSPNKSQQENGHDVSYTGYSDPDYFLTHILSYLETPPHLRKTLFPMHPNLRLAGSLPSLDMPHHLRKHEWCRYREGVAISEKIKHGTFEGMTRVDTGLSQVVFVEAEIPANTRVTVDLGQNPVTNGSQEVKATAVAPTTPREKNGFYWGYNTRYASSLSNVLTECPFDGGYNMSIGTSERGAPLSDLLDDPSIEFQHMLIVFGGVAGLEVAVKADEELDSLGVKAPEALFDRWINLCPGQGSRTIRTEEAVWIGLTGLRDTILRRGR